MSKASWIWVLGAGGLVLAQVVASLLLPQTFALTAFSDIIQFFLLLSGTLVFLPILFTTEGRVRVFWAFLMVGVGLWWIYQLILMYFEIGLRQDVPNPFVGDVVLFLHIVPMMAALAMQPHKEQDERTTRLGSLDFALLLAWWLYLYLFAVIPWQYAFSDATKNGNSFNALYLTEKMAFLAGLVVLWWNSNRSWKTVYAHLFGASLTYSFSSYFVNWAIDRNIYYSGSLYDIPLVVSMAWFTFAGVTALHLAPPQQPGIRKENHGVWVARLGMIAIYSLPLFAAWSLFDTSIPSQVRTFRLAVTLGSMLFMGILVFLKQHLLDNELLGLLRTSQDSVDNLKRLQAQLVQSEKLASLGQLVGGAAHELNNPLTAMLGYADLLAETPLTDEQRAMAEKIGHQVRRTKNLVANLLSFAKQTPAEKTMVDVNSLAQTAVKLAQPQLRTHNIELRTELGSHLPQVLGDSNQLLQVCLQVINNGLYAMAETGGVLRVITHAAEDLVILEFVDDGPGAQDPDRVFDPFYTTRPVGQGTGLGLSACYGIVQEHQGKIMCRNRAEGGATFRVELPAAARKTSPHGKAEGDAEQSSAEHGSGTATLTLRPTP